MKHIKTKKSGIIYDQEGYIDLSKSLYLMCLKQFPGCSQDNGKFIEGYYLFSDGTKYISKILLDDASEFSDVNDENCRYNPIIATGIAKELGIDTSENTLARKVSGSVRIFSKYFLKSNEELITFYEHNSHQRISDVFKELETALLLRKFPRDQIEKTKFDFLKQEFLAKLIGLCDQTEDNTTLIISVDDEGKKSVRLAPMYDYDFSFNTVRGVGFRKRHTDDGKTDIASLVKQYKDYPGFLDFVKKSVNTLDMDRVYENIYKDTGIKIFENSKENADLEDDYTEFLRDRLKTDYTAYVNTNLCVLEILLKSFEKDEIKEK